MRKVVTPWWAYALCALYVCGVGCLLLSWGVVDDSLVNVGVRVQVRRLGLPKVVGAGRRVGWMLGWGLVVLAMAVAKDRRWVLRAAREQWRQTRNDAVVGVRDNWSNRRQVMFQFLHVFLILSVAGIAWRAITLLCNSESPVVVVLSGSMEPDFYRGDILFLTNNWDDPMRVGEVMVFKIEGRDIPIVHRVMQVHEDHEGNVKLLTKGDNNRVNDRGLYAEGQDWLSRSDIVGRARFFTPHIGMVTILLNETPYLKPVVVSLLLVAMVVNREV